MPTIAKLPSGSWRAQVRRKGRYVSETFLRPDDALRWSRLAELSVDRNETPVSSRIGRITKFGELVKLHIEDMTAVGKPPRRSKAATLDMLQRKLGTIKKSALDRERLIQFGRARSEAGAGPVTLGIDIGAIGLVLSHAAAVHGLSVSTEQVALARFALKRLGLIGRGVERDRRPTESEVGSPIALFESNERQIIPVGRIIRFAIATAMRLDEICRVDWGDVNERTRMLLTRDRKDPRYKQGNDQRIPLFGPSG
jgi:integrase